MPYEFAIKTRSDRLAPRPEVYSSYYRDDEHYYTHYPKVYEYDYNPCHQTLAENSPEGVFRLVSVHGKAMMNWTPITVFHEWENLKYEANSQVRLPDAAGTPLQPRDYVMTTLRHSEMRLCRVVNFTQKRIRVLDLLDNKLVMRTSEEIVKVSNETYLTS